MSGLLFSGVVRIFCGAVVCMIALLLAGDGPGKEPVRISCACLMIILVLSFFGGTGKIDLSLEQYSGSVQSYVDQALVEMEEEKQNQVGVQIGEYVRTQAGLRGIDCKVNVGCSLQGGAFSLEYIEITPLSEGDPGGREALLKQLSGELGIGADRIRFLSQGETG